MMSSMMIWIDANTTDAGIIAGLAIFYIALNWRRIHGRL